MTAFEARVAEYERANVGHEAAVRAVRREMPDAAREFDQQRARRDDIAEKDEQRYIEKLLRTFGFETFNTSQARASRIAVGLPDVYAISTRKPLALWVEVKRQSGGRVSAHQARFAELCRAAGVLHLTGDRYVVEAWLVSVGLAERVGATLEPVR